MSEIYLIRHAQASYLSDNYDQLSEKGKEQARRLAHLMYDMKLRFDYTYVGPLVRQNETLDIISEKIQCQNRVQLSEFKEHHGPQALKAYYNRLIEESEYVKELWNRMQKNESLRRTNSLKIFEYFITQWISGKINVPDIEPWHEFKTHAERGLNIVKNKLEKGQKALIVTSGGTIATLLSGILKMQDLEEVASMNYMIRNSSVTKLYSKGSKLALLSFNEVSHLPPDYQTFV